MTMGDIRKMYEKDIMAMTTENLTNTGVQHTFDIFFFSIFARCRLLLCEKTPHTNEVVIL